jgi:hypothetical protein
LPLRPRREDDVEEVSVYFAFCGNYVPFILRSDATQEEVEILGSNHFKGNLGLIDFKPPVSGTHYRIKAMCCRDRDNAAWIDCRRSDSADEEWVLFGQELTDDEIVRVMEDRWYTPLKKLKEKVPRPLENNSTIMFARKLTDDEIEEEEISGVPAVDPLELFRDRSWYKPPRPMTPVNFRSSDIEFDDRRDYIPDEFIPKIIHQITAGPHYVSLVLRQDASMERILEVLRRRTGITGKWRGTITDEGNTKENKLRRVFLVPVSNVTVPKNMPIQLIEARVFFGTLERKSSCPVDPTPEQTMLQFAREAKMDDRWVVDRDFAGTTKSPPIVVAKRSELKEFRQALPDGLDFFIADHVEAGRHVNYHRIKCTGGKSSDKQAMMVSQAFMKPMKISEWVAESDGLIHNQCSRLDFVEIRFKLGERSIDS